MKLHIWILCSLSVFTVNVAAGQTYLDNIIRQNPLLHAVATNPEHEVQIIYTSISQDNSWSTEEFQVNDSLYFYPASTVKLPVAILALQKINELNEQGITVGFEDHMITLASQAPQQETLHDSTAADGMPSIKRYIEKIFLVSDNDAYNRLYVFVTPDKINRDLIHNGTFTTSVINQRVGAPGFDFESNRTTNPVVFRRNLRDVYKQDETTAVNIWKHRAKNARKGKGYIDGNGKLIMESFDFGTKNFYCLRDLEITLQKIIFPEHFKNEQRFNLKQQDYEFLKKAMSTLPEDDAYYRNDKNLYDGYVKFLMMGDHKYNMPEGLKIYNKVGNAYGYLIDCAYFEHKEKNIRFFLTAVIHTNADGIYNDGVYEYDEIGLPFLGELGRAVYQFELGKSSCAR
jgi:hypothetical protein